MKRSEMIELISNTYDEHKCGDEPMPELIAEAILNKMEERGMQPPAQECKVIPDTNRGGMKHGPCQRVWDEE